MPQTASVPYCFSLNNLVSQCLNVLVNVLFPLYFRLRLICKMSYELIYDRDHFYVMILFKKEQKGKKSLCWSSFYWTSSRRCVCDIYPKAATVDINKHLLCTLCLQAKEVAQLSQCLAFSH